MVLLQTGLQNKLRPGAKNPVWPVDSEYLYMACAIIAVVIQPLSQESKGGYWVILVELSTYVDRKGGSESCRFKMKFYQFCTITQKLALRGVINCKVVPDEAIYNLNLCIVSIWTDKNGGKSSRYALWLLWGLSEALSGSVGSVYWLYHGRRRT